MHNDIVGDSMSDLAKMKERYESLLAKHEAVVVERDAVAEKLDIITKRYAGLVHEYEKLKKSILGPKRESLRANDAQLSLLGVLEALGRLQEGDESAGDDAEEALEHARALLEGEKAQGTPKKAKPKGRRKRAALKELPLQRVVLEPPEREAEGGERLQCVDEVVTEYVEHIPSSKMRIQIVRPKYIDPEVPKTPATLGAPLCAAALPQKSQRFYIADLPELPVPRCLAGPGLLAQVLVSKYGDHIPLHRQVKIYKRDGLIVSRSTLCDWVKASARLLSRIAEAMWEDARQNAVYSLTDATGVLVQAKHQCKRSHFYVVAVPDQHVLFRYTQINDGETVAAILKGFSGYIHADAAQVYHELYRREEKLIEVGCWSHARRKFFEALMNDAERALVGIGFISRLYDAHRATWDKKTKTADVKKRAELARPVLARLLWWVRQELRSVEDPSPIRSALIYLKNQRKALTRFLYDGMLRLDNNISELELRRLVVGRKNWLFCGSDNGAEWAATAVSLIASCEMLGIEPWAYIKDVLDRLLAGETDYAALRPDVWRVAHPEAIRQYRVAERRDRADRKQNRRAARRRSHRK